MAARTRPLQTRIQPVVLGLILTCGQGVAAEPLAVEFVYVPASDVQPDGPAHDFRMGRFEIRNDQFVGFLNDALANLSEPQGQYLYFDIDSGDVYIHTAQVGTVGVDGAGTLAFSASINGHIAYEAGVYRVTDGSFEAHPVTGVTWYGAVKFCNWLTVSTGLPPAERAYGEGPAADSNNAWRPVVIDPTDWATRDLDGSERAALLGKLGYRLPMDGGEEVAGLYNEWHKAASARRHLDGTVVFDSIHGFGRDSILDPDANYLGSGDPFEPGTTPVGFFDGINLLADGATLTHDSENGYGLYDLSGNVWEWMQDQAPSDPGLRRNRGGSWQSNAATLAIALGSERTASAAVASTGFRIVQSVPEAVLITPFPGLEAEGLWGGPYDDPFSDRATYRLTNVVDDCTLVLVTAPAWVSVEPAAILAPPGLSVEPATSLEVTLSLTPACDDGLSIGANIGTVTFMNGDSGRIMAQRSVSMTVREPVELTPAEGFSPRMVFGGTPIPRSTFYQLGNASDKSVLFSVSWEETTEEPTGRAWLTLNDAESTSGEILSHDVASIQARIDADEAALLAPGAYTADLTFTDDCTGTEFVRIVTLAVDAPFDVAPTADVESSGVFGGPFVPPAHRFTVSNPLDVPVSWTMTVAHEPSDATECGPPEELWLEPLTSGGTLGPDQSVEVEVTITSAAERLEACRHSLTLSFEDPGSGFVVTRRVTLDVTGLRVDPPQDAEFRGPLAGPFLPEELVYTLHNVGQPELIWSASIEVDDAAGVGWLAVTPASGVILDPDGTDTAVLSMTGEAASLPPGTYRGSVTFTPNDTEAAEAVRAVTLIVGGEAFKVAMAGIGPRDVQPGGPDHFFRIGTFEITNTQYSRFLNDVFRNQALERAQYVYHDTDSGSVYINDAARGDAGTDAPSPSLTTLLYDASVGRISFDAALPEPYVIEVGFGDHPVVGVSWYGAAKFCNWMTLVQGMSSEARVYSEGVAVDFWGPVQSDRAAMLAQPGFRLSMDNGASTADLYNEWYKAASARPPDEGSITFGAIYGFGQDALTGADANFLDSGEPSGDETTPAGFFDGINTLLDGALTSDTANGYGLYDLCGNVAEWIHDRDGTGEFAIGATRGGHFKSDGDFAQLRSDTRNSLPADSTFAFVGFRVAQSLRPLSLVVLPLEEELSAHGPVGGLYSRNKFLLQLQNRGSYTLDDLTITIDVAWLDFDGPPPQQVPPEATVDLALRLTQEADLLVPQQTLGATVQPEIANFAMASKSMVTHLDADPGTTRGTQHGVLNHDRLTRPDPLKPIRRVEPDPREPEPTGHVGTITVTDGITDMTVERRVVLLVHEPLSVTPEERWEATGPYCFDFTGPSRTYTVSNESAADMPWVLEIDQDWLTLAGPDGEVSGSLPGGGDQTIPFTVSFNEAANVLPPGEHVATVTLRNTFTERNTQRDVMITVDWPITVEWSDPQPDFSAIWRGPVEGPEDLTLTISRCGACESECALNYRVETDASWLSVEPESELVGPVPPPGESVTLTVTITEAAVGLGVDEYTGTVRILVTDPEQGQFPDPLEMTADLTIFDPIAITPEADRWEIGCELKIADPPRRTYTLTNRHLADEIGVSVDVDVDWIEVEPTELTILPGGAADVTLSITEGALPSAAAFPLQVRFLDTLTGHTQVRDVVVAVAEDLCVTPLTDYEAAGRVGGSIEPRAVAYTLTNVEDHDFGELEWRVSSDEPWILIDGAASAGGVLSDGGSARIVLSVDAARAPELPPGRTEAVREALVRFDNLTGGMSLLRRVRLTLVRPHFEADPLVVSATAAQPSGPTYSFHMNRFHTTLAEFAAFLNDALTHPNHPRGHFMFFHTTTGDVYVNSAMIGQSGDDAGGRSVLMFSPSASGQIELAGGVYRVVTTPVDYSRHPVAGVSWYGAVKYCNWLTLDQGMLPGQRCYIEATESNPGGWRPVTIPMEDWAVGDLDDQQRRKLVTQYTGYRLPMDDGYDNTLATSDAADAFNEWYKAAAWNPTLRRNTVFGFGRDTLGGGDANYRCSGDPFEDLLDCIEGGSTPVGYFDGAVKNDGEASFSTNPNGNGFGLFDVTGNVHQWLQGRYAPPVSVDRRTLRGGSWDDAVSADSLRSTRRTMFAPPGITSSRIGFRVVRTRIERTGDRDLDGDVDLDDFVWISSCGTGPQTPARVECLDFDFDFDDDVDLKDVAEFQRAFRPSP